MRSALQASAAVPVLELLLVDTVLVPGGTFVLGSLDGRPDEQPVRRVPVASFRLGRIPVSNAQYAPFLAESDAAAEPPWWRDPAFSACDQPVVGITWFEAVAFTTWLSQRLGGRWRLPAEAEWERAMRGGHEGASTCWGGAIPRDEIPEGKLVGPWPLGKGTPNAFGLCDPGTVVHEWCKDEYRGYGDEPACMEVPAPPERRSSRGGSWRHRQRWSPPSARSSLPPSMRYADYGFRVLREVD